jgi:hypothetical protein
MTPETSSPILPRLNQRADRTEVSTCTISPRFGWENKHIGIEERINTYFANLRRFFFQITFPEEKPTNQVSQGGLQRKKRTLPPSSACLPLHRHLRNFLLTSVKTPHPCRREKPPSSPARYEVSGKRRRHAEPKSPRARAR